MLRVSTVKQDLTPQREAVLAAARKEYKESEIVIVQGKESAIKLAEMERQTLNELKSVVEQYPSIECVYFFSVDRLARRVSVVMSIKEWADSKQINLVFLNPYPFSTWFKSTEGIWKKNDISDVYLMFLAFGAKMEMEIKQERFAAAKALNKQLNKPTNMILYGYKTDADKNLMLHPQHAKVIRWIFDSYLKKNLSTREIYEEGVELGYWENRQENTSKSNHIRNILINYCYAGGENKGGLRYPPIVNKEDVDAAIELMHTKKVMPKNNNRADYLCKGILKDETSGYTLRAKKWHCRYSILQNIDNAFGVNMNVADTLIWRTAMEVKWNLITHADSTQKEKIEAELNNIEDKILNLKDYIEKNIQPKYTKAYDAYVNGKGRITQDMYNNTISNLDAEHKQFTQKVEALEKRQIELLAVYNELMHKEKRDVSIYSIKEISDDKQRLEIIKECITNMTVKALGHKQYIFKVHHKLATSPTMYLYVNKGQTTHLYLINGEFDIDNIKQALEECKLIDITDEIEYRHVRGKDAK